MQKFGFAEGGTFICRVVYRIGHYSKPKKHRFFSKKKNERGRFFQKILDFLSLNSGCRRSHAYRFEWGFLKITYLIYHLKKRIPAYRIVRIFFKKVNTRLSNSCGDFRYNEFKSSQYSLINFMLNYSIGGYSFLKKKILTIR